MIELELFDRAQQKVLLALESRARLTADHFGFAGLARRERAQRVESCETDERRGENRKADEDQVLGARAANDEDRYGGQNERAERKKLPRPQRIGRRLLGRQGTNRGFRARGRAAPGVRRLQPAV